MMTRGLEEEDLKLKKFNTKTDRHGILKVNVQWWKTMY
jgi:hypothetical protein